MRMCFERRTLQETVIFNINHTLHESRIDTADCAIIVHHAIYRYFNTKEPLCWPRFTPGPVSWLPKKVMQSLFRPVTLHFVYHLKTSYVRCHCALLLWFAFSISQVPSFVSHVVSSLLDVMKGHIVHTEPPPVNPFSVWDSIPPGFSMSISIRLDKGLPCFVVSSTTLA